MMKRVNGEKYQTVQEICDKYSDYWVRWGDREEDDFVYVIAIADTLDELLTISDEEMKKEDFTWWSDAYPARLSPQEPQEFGGLQLEQLC